MAIDAIERVGSSPTVRESLLDDEVRPYYQALLTRLPWPGGLKNASAVRSLGVTACRPGQGGSTIASRLAATAAASGPHRVLLVDCNATRPSVHRTFGVPLRPGLAETLADPESLSEAIQPTWGEGLWVLTSGRSRRRGRSTADPVAFSGLAAELTAEFDLVVVDLPSTDRPEVLTPLAAALDGLLLVVESDRVRCEVAREATEQLRMAGIELLGVVLNKRR